MQRWDRKDNRSQEVVLATVMRAQVQSSTPRVLKNLVIKKKKRPVVVADVCNPRAGETGTGALELAGQSA